MSNEAKHTPLRVLAIRTDPAEGMDGWWLNIWGQSDYGGNIGWLNGGDENAERTAQLERAVNSYEATQRLLVEIVSAWEALPGGQQQSVRAMEAWLAKDMKPAIDNTRAAIAEHRKATP